MILVQIESAESALPNVLFQIPDLPERSKRSSLPDLEASASLEDLVLQ